MSPFGYTMCLVDSIERNLRALEEADVLLFRQRLGCHIKEFRATLADIFLRSINLCLRERRVEIVGDAIVVSQLTYGIHLILHEGNEGRHNDGCAFAYQSWQLIAERFASASRHKDKGILPFEKVTDDGFLVTLEGVETKIMLQLFSQVNIFHLGGNKKKLKTKLHLFS